MKLRALILGCPLLLAPAAADAGGMFLPGSGAVSSSRAGAAVASASDGEALSLNPAGLAKSKGTTITLSAAILNYAMEFTRRGTYDDIAAEALPYEGQAYPTVKNDPDPPLGIGRYQPVPVFAVSSDLGGAVKGLTVAAGVYAPNAYPFRDMCTELASGCQKYAFNGDFNVAPAPTRYDIMEQEAAVIVPSVAVAYRATPELDVGVRFGAGFGDVKSRTALWGALNNYTEYVKQDSVFEVDAKDSFVPSFGLGIAYRPSPVIELGAAYNSQMSLLAKGTAKSENGPAALLMGNPIIVLPTDPGFERCETGGTREAQRACVELALPMTLTVGGRYKFLDRDGKERGDIELDLAWENWSAERVDKYRVVVDGVVYTVNSSGQETPTFTLEDSYVKHGFQDTFGARLGGSYRIPAGTAEVILRGGVAYDSRAAKEGWLRADIDGAARTTATVGVGYRAQRFEVNVGGGFVYEGTNDNPGTCNPDGGAVTGCAADGSEQPVGDRRGPDPITPIIDADHQAQNPVNQGTFDSHYVMLMLGVSTWF